MAIDLQKRKIIKCKKCRKSKGHHAKGMCFDCYHKRRVERLKDKKPYQLI